MRGALSVIPAQAGNQQLERLLAENWLPACAGMTRGELEQIPHEAFFFAESDFNSLIRILRYDASAGSPL